jgi:hypothetical protein
LYDEEGKENDRSESEYVDGNLVKHSMYSLGKLKDYSYDSAGKVYATAKYMYE